MSRLEKMSRKKQYTEEQYEADELRFRQEERRNARKGKRTALEQGILDILPNENKKSRRDVA